MDPKDRRENLLKSLEPSGGGEFTTHWVKEMAEVFGGRLAECTITGHCRTFVFKFPGSYLAAEEPGEHQVIYPQDGLKASIVSDLPAYFEQDPAESLHYSIDVSLRANVRNIYEKAVEQSNQQPDPEVRLFVVIEEYTEVPPTVLNRGECFMIDEYRDGKAKGAGKARRPCSPNVRLTARGPTSTPTCPS